MIQQSRAGPAARAESGVLADDRDRDVNDDVGVQSDRHGVLAGGFQRADRQANLRFFNCETLLRQRFSDVEAT